MFGSISQAVWVLNDGINLLVERNAFNLLLKLIPPTVLPRLGSIGIATIVHHDHVQFIIISLKSFFYYSGVTLPVFLVDDGSLTDSDCSVLRKNFKNILIKRHPSASREMTRVLKKFPYCLRYRKKKHLEFRIHNKKLFDPLLLNPFMKVILLDADVLFYNTPYEMVQWIRNDEKVDLYMAYDKDYMDKEKFWGVLGIKILAKIWNSPITPYFNSGLYCVTKKNIYLKNYEKYLKKFYYMNIQDELISDQFFHSMNVTENVKKIHSYKIKRLPANQYVVLVDLSSRKRLFQKKCIHYHAELKRFLPRDGIMLMMKTFFFKLNKQDSSLL